MTRLGLFAAVYCGTATALSVADTDLRLVQVITRHGARTPFSKLPSSVGEEWDCTLRDLSVPSSDDSRRLEPARLYRKNFMKGLQYLPGNCMTGQLTQTGYNDHFELGQRFRQQYVNDQKFLPARGYPSPEHIYVRSTDVPRTLASAKAQLLAFFPPGGKTDGTEVRDIDVIEEGDTESMKVGNKCPKMLAQCNALQNTTAWKARFAKFEATKSKLASAWGVSEDDMPFVNDIYDNLKARVAHNLSLPAGVDRDAYNEVDELATYTMKQAYEYGSVARLGIGVFLTEVMDKFEKAVKGKSTLKWIFYSSHDTTVGLFLAALKAFQDWPKFAANIVMELRTHRARAYVRMLYNGEVITLPGCDNHELCPYKRFAEIAGASTLTHQQWVSECEDPDVGPPVSPVSRFLC